MVSENFSSFSFDDPSLILSIISIIISATSVAVTFLYNKRMYKLAYEQDLLIRKEKHFNELKKYVIEPLLYEDKRSSFNPYFFIDMVRYHYPEVGDQIKQLVKKYKLYENLEENIVNTCLAIINEKGRKESIEFSITKYKLKEHLSSIIRILIHNELQYQKYIDIKPPLEFPVDAIQNKDKHKLIQITVRYELRFLGSTIYVHEDADIVLKAKEVFLEALNEMRNDKKLRKLAEQYQKIGLELPRLNSKVRKELIRLLEQPPTALKLVNNVLCPYMKGQEDKEFSREEKTMIENLLKNFPGEKRGFIVD